VVFERLTDRSREVLVCGRLAAQQCGHRSIEAPHLVVGLLRHRETNGCQALNRAGLHYVDALTAVQGMYEPAEVGPDAPPVLTAQAKRLLEDALHEAAGAGGRFIETAHLALANVVRTQRAQVKRDLKAGRVAIHTLLLDPPAFLETAKVFDVLLAVPTFGRVRVHRLLTQCRISPSKTIGGLSERQRDALVELLRPR